MTQPTHSQPVEPVVEQIPFRDRTYKPQNILPFTEVAHRLPEPVLSNHQEWVEMYWRAWEIAWSNLRRPRPASGFVSNFIDTAVNGQTRMWDSAFMTQFGLYGRRAFNFMDTLNNFYAKQHDDGFICRAVDTEQGQALYHPFDPNGAGPNVMAWAEWRYFRLTGDDGRLTTVFKPLVALHRWFRANRSWPNGLYWATGLSSGMDNQPRVPGGLSHHGHWTWVDANMQAALNCLILGRMATLLTREKIVEEMTQERTHLLREINARLWNSEESFYQDVDRHGRHGPVKSIGAYWALLDKEMVSPDRLDPFLRHLREATTFKRPHRVPSLAADSEGYNLETGDYWCGAVWPATNFMLLKGLRAVGQHTLAHSIAVNHLDNVGAVYQHSDTFWENYAPETAAPGEPARANFVGTSGLSPITILLEDVIGITVDWPLRRVLWDRRLPAGETYGVRNYPLGLDGMMELVGDQENVYVSTDVPFTLTIQDEEQSLQTAVAAGATEISLI